MSNAVLFDGRTIHRSDVEPAFIFFLSYHRLSWTQTKLCA